jgi:LPXTG-motif cell wall-anchored protein
VAFVGAPAAAATAVVVLPMTVPVGGQVEINVSECPAPASMQAAAQLSPQGGTVAEQALGATDAAGGARLVGRVPIDGPVGPWTATVTCLDASGAVVGDPVIAPFTVAQFTLLTIQPRTAQPGGSVTVSGSGCPTNTSSAFARTAGASDDPPPLWDPNTPGTRLTLTNLSFSGRVTVPVDAPSGENGVWVYCVSEGGSALAGPFSGVVNVSDALPATGSSNSAWPVGSGLLIAGCTALLAARRHSGRRRELTG